MADLDTLQLHITAEDKASGVVKALAENLTKLGTALNAIKTTNIDHLAQSLQKIQDINKLSGASTSINEMVKAFASINGIDRKAIPELTAEFEKLFKAFASGGHVDITKFTDPVYEIAANNIKLRKVVNETDQAVSDYFKAFNKTHTGKIGIGDLRGELGENYKDFLKMGKGIFVDALPENGLQGIETLLQGIQSIKGSDSVIDFSRTYQGAHDLYDTLKRATSQTYTLEQALDEAKQSNFDKNPADIKESVWTDIFERQIDNVKELSRAYTDIDPSRIDNYFGNITPMFEQLKGVMDEMPDFSPIKTLADNISALGKKGVQAGVDNIPVIADALKSLEGIRIDSMDGLKNIAEVFQSIPKSMPKSTDISGVATELKSIGDAAAETASKMQENMNVDAEPIKESIKSVSEEVKHLGKIDPVDNKSSEKATTLLVNLMALGHEIETLANGFKKLANIGTSALKTIYKPMDMVVDEYKEKIAGMTNALKSFSDNAKVHLKKFSDFWKRTMRTFTFMLVRKAITAVIKDIKDAVDSLAQFESAVGGSFNDSISNAVADFTYIGRAILGAFEPIINVVVPILDTLAAAIARVMALIGHFFAALTGQGYYVTAKKNVTDYAASLDKASKSQKNLTMGIDELNILNESKGGGASAGNPMDEWDMNEVEGWMKDFAAKIKDLFDKIFNPLKQAWDNAKDYIISGFKYMVQELGKLLSSIGRDFLKMWNEQATIDMLTNLLKIIGDIERVIGNLAKAFREAWDEAERGLHILQNIRDILKILVDHVRNVSMYMVGWSKNIDFKPLLAAVEKLTKSLKRVAEFVGGVFEDIFKNVILPYIKWFIEEGAPHTLHMIAKVIDSFNFIKIRNDLKPVEKAFEKMLENIHTGVTNAIGNLGMALSKWTNSAAFTEFMDAIARIMGLITAERVEKLFTALGMAIFKIAEALAQFVSSEKFLNFLDKIAEWFDSLSADQLANVIIRIAGAVGLFNFAAFVGEGIAGFLQFLTMIKATQNIGAIAKELGAVSTNLSWIPKALVGVVGGFAEFFAVKDGISKVVKALNGGSESLIGALTEVGAAVGIAASAFILAFGFPAGLAAAAIVGFIGAIAGIQKAFDDINTEAYSQAVHDALAKPGGVPIEDLVNTAYDNITQIGSGFDVINQKAAELDIAEQDVDNLVEHIGWIGTEFESGAITVDEAAEKMETAISELESAVSTKFTAMREVIIAGLGSNGYISTALAQTGTDVKAFREQAALDLTEAEQKAHDLTEELKTVPTGSERWYEIVDEIAQVAGSFDPVTNAVTDLSNSLANGLDWSTFLNKDGALDAEKLTGELGKLVSAAEDTREKGGSAIREWSQTMKETTNDPEMLDAITKAIPKAFENLNNDTATLTQQVVDTVQTNAVAGLTEVMTQAEEDWNKMTWFEKLLHPEGLDGYVMERANKYKEEVVDPVAEAAEEAMHELGVEGAGWASDATQQILDAISFENVELDGEIAEFVTKLKDGWKENLGTLGETLEGLSTDNAERVINGYTTTIDSDTLAKDSITAWCDGLKEPMEGMGEESEGFGKDTVDGFNTGVESNSDSTKGIVETWMGNIWDWIHNSALKFGSPSEALREFGQNTVEGFNQGIDDFKDTTNEIITHWMDNIRSVIEEKIAGITELIRLQVQEVGVIFDEMSISSDTKFRTMAEKVVTVFVTMKDGVTAAITTLATTLSNTYTLITTNTQVFVESVRTAFMGMTTGVVESINNFTVMMTEQFTLMTEAVLLKVQEMQTRLIDSFMEMRDRLTDLTERIKDTLIDRWERIRSELQQKNERIRDDIERQWERIEDVIERRNDKIHNTIETKWNRIKQMLTQRLEELKKAVETNFDAIEKKVNNKCEKIVEHTNKVGEKFREFAHDKLPEWKHAWNDTWKEIKEIVAEACSEILGMVADMVAEVQAAFSGLKYSLVGDPIVIDMWDDIEDVFGKGADSSLAEVNGLAEDVADSFENMADVLTDAPLFDSLVDGAASAMDATIEVVEDALSDVKSLFDTSLAFPDVDMPTMQVNTDWANMSQSSPFENEEAMNTILGATKNQVEGISNDAIRSAVAEQSDQQQRLFNQMIDLLGDIARKDTNVYMDSRSLVSGISNRQRRNGYDFRMA